jgi:hypothetical protein
MNQEGDYAIHGLLAAEKEQLTMILRTNTVTKT